LSRDEDMPVMAKDVVVAKVVVAFRATRLVVVARVKYALPDTLNTVVEANVVVANCAFRAVVDARVKCDVEEAKIPAVALMIDVVAAVKVPKLVVHVKSLAAPGAT
jgi:hypothetical protein